MNLLHILSNIQQQRPKVLVVGDVMLDHYRIAEATRISPEAPVPVLLNPREEFRLGGAGAVATMCAALGAEVALIGIVGNDSNGRRIISLLNDAGVSFAGMVVSDRITTTKERICGVASGRHRQQLARLDCEDDRPLPFDVQQDLYESIRTVAVDPPDVLLVADYAKGIMTPEIAEACLQASQLTIADPPRIGTWAKYRSFGCIVPNREEAGGQDARRIRTALQTNAAIVKRDQEGCELDAIELTRHSVMIAARPRDVHDVTGAGDQFLAVLACARCCGGSWFTAAELANVAAGMQVERHGCVPVTIEELIHEISNDTDRTLAGSEASTTAGPVLAAAG